MQPVFPRCAGLDVHKKFITVCRLVVDDRGVTHKEIRTFSTMTRDLEALATWLAEVGCTDVAMESSGVYWQPAYTILEGRFQIWLVNAQHIKHVPGRKTDVKDAEWIAQLLQVGLLKPSFIPERDQRDLRDLVRFRQGLVEERSRLLNRVQKVLEGANIKLAAVARDLQGMSARAILRALLAGTREPEVLADLACGKLRKKREALQLALEGHLREHHCFLLTHLLGLIDEVDEEIAVVEAQIEVQVGHIPGARDALERLDTIPGVSRQTALVIIAEVGVDVSRFPSARHLTAWAGLVPGNNQTGGKQRPARARWGNVYLRRSLVQAARAAAHTKDTYLRALYYRLALRRGKNRAAVAVARTILQIAYYVLQRGTTYEELGGNYFERRDQERTTHRLVKRLEGLGYEVSLTAVAPSGESFVLDVAVEHPPSPPR